MWLVLGLLLWRLAQAPTMFDMLQLLHR
jgi:hypothetical protein